MAVYEYTAKDEIGNEFAGTYADIEDVSILEDELSKMGYTLLKARQKKANRFKLSTIKQSEIVTFVYKFAGMYSAGLPITGSLEAIEEQTDNQAFREILSDIRESVEGGSNLKSAFEKHRQIFSDFFIGMVEVGESGGKLAQTLEMSAAYLEKQADIKRKIKAAFTYPIVVGVLSIVIVAAIVVFVVPVFGKLYQQLHVSLPGPTQFLLSISIVVRKWWWAIILAIAGIVYLFRKSSRDKQIKEKWDSIKLRIPIFGKLNQMVAVSKFMRTFAILASTGVSLVKAIEVSGVVVNNGKFFSIADELQESVRKGEPVAKSLKAYSVFPPIIVQLAASGEESGMLSEMVNKGVDFLDKDIDRTINSLLVKLEPAMTVIMGVVVGLILMAVYLPMFDYMSHLK